MFLLALSVHAFPGNRALDFDVVSSTVGTAGIICAKLLARPMTSTTKDLHLCIWHTFLSIHAFPGNRTCDSVVVSSTVWATEIICAKTTWRTFDLNKKRFTFIHLTYFFSFISSYVPWEPNPWPCRLKQANEKHFLLLFIFCLNYARLYC